MKTEDIRSLVAALGVGEHFYIGRLDKAKPKSVGIYRRSAGQPIVAIGAQSGYELTRVSLLIHYSRSFTETETAAQTLYDALKSIRNQRAGSAFVFFIMMKTSSPVDIGSDDGIWEQVIDFDIYERKVN